MCVRACRGLLEKCMRVRECDLDSMRIHECVNMREREREEKRGVR